MGSSSVSIVVPTYKRPETLGRTLGALASVSYQGPFEIIVVDDGSGDSTGQVVEAVRREHPHLDLTFLEQQNGGAARARNRGARAAEGEVLIFLDDDMLVAPDHLVRHMAHLADPESKTIVNGHWEFAPEIHRELESSSFGRFRLWLETWFKDGLDMEHLDEDLLKPNMLTACNLGIRRQDFLALGGFDETFPAAGYEDQDLAMRATRAGFTFLYDKRISLSHVDQRTNLNDFSRRIRQGALTAGIMAQKYPTEYGLRPIIRENSPASTKDRPALLLKKLVKSTISSGLGRRTLRTFIFLVDRLAPDSRLMHKAYWKWCGIWIYLGVREGLRFTPVDE